MTRPTKEEVDAAMAAKSRKGLCADQTLIAEVIALREELAEHDTVTMSEIKRIRDAPRYNAEAVDALLDAIDCMGGDDAFERFEEATAAVRASREPPR